METITPEQEIEQQLIQELQKLRKAVAYIEEAKETIATSEKLLAAMNVRYEQLKLNNTDYQAAVKSVETELQKKIASDKKSITKSLQAVNSRFETIEATYKSELNELRKTNKKLKVVSYTSLTVSMLFLISLILILVAAINDL